MFGLMKKIGGDPRAYRQEIGSGWGGYKTKLGGTQVGLATGLASGTRVATTSGWRPVEAIAAGDLVLTFDRGMQPVRQVTRGMLWSSGENCPPSLWPLRVPAGALGNLEEMVLLAEQAVLLESDAADLLFDDPFALLNATDLVGFRGIERVPPMGDIEVIQLHFEEDEVIFAAAGALIFCPSLKVFGVAELLAAELDAARYSVLAGDDAEMLVECLLEDVTSIPGVGYPDTAASLGMAAA